VKLLAIDTATEHCSAALWLDGPGPQRRAPLMRGNGELVLQLTDQLLAEAGLSLSQLDAIAFGRGPGAFTGVRLSASTAQGLAFTADLPVIGISNLRALAQQLLARPGAPDRGLICQDARMSEVYWGGFRRDAGVAVGEGAEQVSPPTVVLAAEEWWRADCWGGGSGFGAFAELARQGAARLGQVASDLASHAADIALLAARDGLVAAVPAELAQPVYLRDRVAELPSG